jgi:hypothetical protein
MWQGVKILCGISHGWSQTIFLLADAFLQVNASDGDKESFPVSQAWKYLDNI